MQSENCILSEHKGPPPVCMRNYHANGFPSTQGLVEIHGANKHEQQAHPHLAMIKEYTSSEANIILESKEILFSIN